MSSTTLISIEPERLAKLERLLDRQEILDCLTRLQRGIDRFDRDLFLSSFHDDAIVDGGGYLNSPGAVYDGAAALHEEGQSTTQHNILNHTCDVDGDVAHAETYLQFNGRNRDETNWICGGRYLDRLERRKGEWKIAFRYTLIEWSGMIPPATVPLFENVPDLHMNGVPSRNKSDPSYRRPLVNKRPLRAPVNPRELGAPLSRPLGSGDDTT